MTQVQEWSNQELDEWLAVNCMGWREDEHPEVHGTGQWMAEYEFPVYFKPDGSFILSGDFLPSTDPAASLEVQTAAYSKNPIQFMRNIAEVQGWNAGARISIEEAGQLANPTLRERAEAAYITLQGAVGDEGS